MSRKKSKAQVAVEYLLVLALGLFLLMGGLYVFFSYSASTNSRVAYAQIGNIGNSLILSAESVASMSTNSWTTVQAQVPDNVKNITIYNTNMPGVVNELIFTTETQTSDAEVVIYTTLPIVGNFFVDENTTHVQDPLQPFPGKAKFKIISYQNNITITRTS